MAGRSWLEHLDPGELVALVDEEVGDRDLATGGRGVQRDGGEVLRGDHGLRHVVALDLQLLGELGDRGLVVQRLAEVRGGGPHRQDELLDGARRPYSPAVVAEVLLDVTGDGGRGVGREGAPAARFEPSYGLDQRQQGHLFEVLDVDAPALVAVRDPQGQALVEQHDLVEQPLAGGRGPGRGRPPEQALGAHLVALPPRGQPGVVELTIHGDDSGLGVGSDLHTDGAGGVCRGTGGGHRVAGRGEVAEVGRVVLDQGEAMGPGGTGRSLEKGTVLRCRRRPSGLAAEATQDGSHNHKPAAGSRSALGRGQ